MAGVLYTDLLPLNPVTGESCTRIYMPLTCSFRINTYVTEAEVDVFSDYTGQSGSVSLGCVHSITDQSFMTDVEFHSQPTIF